ncbi:D-alanyl-D-alanine carboxypeptidase [Microbispora rosea]|uniref:D-alanyl-D-alanine carboxypeptidase n=1 Tax=Microbispora rosea TaxID=58117 RepID=A0A1N7C272_9ACTN|nr:serine hydrolase domain-containing protein [Microbispora rosea]SIR57670.1 D-alanyl-D-alanine carboxypeptidase [Microbispora rosea]
MRCSTSRFRCARSRSRRWTGACAAVLAVLGVQAPSAAPLMRPDADVVQKLLDDLVHRDGFPAALAAVRSRDGRVRDYTAGVGDPRTRARTPVDGEVRIGSNTKTFVSVVVLQLAGEGKVRLDEPVETYLPGLIRGNGNDGRRVTVRQLLQHTSGLPEYTGFLDLAVAPYRYDYYEPRRLLDMALQQKPAFAPGTRWKYTNTNYIVAGLLIERVTGRPVAEEITNRVIRRLGLRHTYFPAVGERGIRGPHADGYQQDPGKPLVDMTDLDPSWAWAAGQMVSTPAEINRFFGAVVDGKLLRPEQLKEMRRTVAVSPRAPGMGYGLGLFRRPLKCGGQSWGHGGEIPGYSTWNSVTDDGRAAAIAVTRTPLPSDAAEKHLDAAIQTALCGG